MQGEPLYCKRRPASLSWHLSQGAATDASLLHQGSLGYALLAGLRLEGGGVLAPRRVLVNVVSLSRAVAMATRSHRPQGK